MATAFADSGYQADKKKRYPIDTAAHTRSAATFFARETNRAKYTKEQQDTIDAKISAAKKKFGIGESKAAPAVVAIAAPAAALTADDVRAIVAEAVSKAAPAPAAPLDLSPLTDAVAAIGTSFEAHKADLDNRLAVVTTAATAATERAASAEKTLAAVVGKAAEATAAGGIPTSQTDGTVKEHPATGEVHKAAAPALPPGSSSLMAAIHAQRYGEQD